MVARFIVTSNKRCRLEPRHTTTSLICPTRSYDHPDNIRPLFISLNYTLQNIWDITQEMSYIHHPCMIAPRLSSVVCFHEAVYCCPHYASVMVPILRCRGSKRRWVRISTNDSRRFPGASLGTLRFEN